MSESRCKCYSLRAHCCRPWDVVEIIIRTPPNALRRRPQDAHRTLGGDGGGGGVVSRDACRVSGLTSVRYWAPVAPHRRSRRRTLRLFPFVVRSVCCSIFIYALAMANPKYTAPPPTRAAPMMMTTTSAPTSLATCALAAIANETLPTPKIWRRTGYNETSSQANGDHNGSNLCVCLFAGKIIAIINGIVVTSLREAVARPVLVCYFYY